MKKTICLTGILTGLFLLTHISLSFSAEWVYIIRTDDFSCHYDKASIKRMPDNIVRVWWKVIFYTEKEITRKEFGDRYKDLEHSLSLIQINCNEKKHSILETIYYDSKGSIIYTIGNSSGKESFIPPETIGDILYEIVCKNE